MGIGGPALFAHCKPTSGTAEVSSLLGEVPLPLILSHVGIILNSFCTDLAFHLPSSDFLSLSCTLAQLCGGCVLTVCLCWIPAVCPCSQKKQCPQSHGLRLFLAHGGTPDFSSSSPVQSKVRASLRIAIATALNDESERKPSSS